MKWMKRMFALLLVCVLTVGVLPVSAADSFEISSFDYGYWGPKDTPLLVVLVNCDPSGNGADGENGEIMLKHKDHSYWSEMLFGNGPKGLKAYFETQSGGNFRFIPAKESFADLSKKNKENDGIVEVTVNTSISSSTSGSTSDPERYAALAAAVEKGYVNFADYDTDGNGRVDESELMIAFITAGYESTRSSSKPSYNAHMSTLSYDFNGVKLSTDYVKVGEMMSNSSPLTVGSFCHELGHALGNGDLYAAGARETWGGWNAPAGGASVMGATGGGSAGKNDGESSGTTPSNYDPYHSTIYGFRNYANVSDGEYTLYSHQSTKGEYNIIKVTTPNPMEYYLIENRYFDNSSTHFDATSWKIPTEPAILIWHVDQGIADAGRAGAGMRINSNGTNPDIGVAALAPKAEGDNWNPATPGTFNVKGQVFDCRAYAFPGSGTWHTSLTDAQAENFHLKIEILDAPGHEMRIKITGAAENVSPCYTFNARVAENTISCVGQITDLNRQTLTGLRLELSDTEDFAKILKTVSVTPDSKGNYEGAFTELADGNYYVRVMLVTKTGEFSESSRCRVATQVYEKTTYRINFYRDPENSKRAYGKNYNVGEPIIVDFLSAKPGYVFLGWYQDAAYTEYFDVSKGKDDSETISLYARWVKAEETAKLTVVGATLASPEADPTGAAAVGETFREPFVVMEEDKEFVGWFADEACTIPFEFDTVIESAAEVKIYAKWKDEAEETTTGAQPVETTTASSAIETTVAAEETTTSVSPEGTTAGIDDPEEPSGEGINLVGIVIAVVVGVGVIAAVAVILIKKKR